MPLPSFISSPSTDGDSNKYPASTRVPESTHQWLMDLQSDYEMHSRSEAVRACVFFAQEYLLHIAEKMGQSIGKKLAASSKADAIIREQERRRAAHTKVLELLQRASEEPLKPYRARLESAAKDMAKAWSIPYPPPDMPLTARDQDAASVLMKVQQIMNEKQINTIKLNDLNPRMHRFNADKLREILERLAEHDYLELMKENTSGPETVLITIPTLRNGVFV